MNQATPGGAAERWWGPLHPPAEGALVLGIGALDLRVARLGPVVQLAWGWTRDPASGAAVRAEQEDRDVPAGHEVRRFAAGDAPLSLAPRLADRFVVARPERQTVVPAGGVLEAYVGSPAWVAVEAAGGVLVDLPAARLSKTWFGPSTMEGELAYALRTRLVTALDRLPVQAYRAITRVVVENLAASPLEIVRLRMPMERLGLYAGSGRLWTEGLRFVRRADDEEAEVQVEDMPGPADRAEPVAPPRRRAEGPSILRAFNALLPGGSR